MKDTDIVTGEETIVEAVSHLGVVINLESSDVNKFYDGMVQRVLDNLSNFQRRGSSWVRSFIHQGRRLAVGSLSTCLQPTTSAEA